MKMLLIKAVKYSLQKIKAVRTIDNYGICLCL